MSTYSPIWPQWQRILFRYAAVFFSFILLSLLTEILSLDKILWDPLVKFTAKHIFGLGEVSKVVTGSGDSLYDWAWYGTILVLSLVLGTLFNLLDFKRVHYQRLQAWLHYLLSVYLAFMLLTYGIIKLYGSQFPAPGLMRLHETYGHSSPMRLLWTFMGASTPYVIFAGACETIPGVLLLFRRTRTLGGLISFGVMTNVFALNIFYDVPVKLFSFQLVIISLFLILPETGRLLRFFVLNKEVAPAEHTPITRDKRWRWAITAIQFVLVAVFVYTISSSTKESLKTYGSDREQPALYGVYDVSDYVINGDTIPTLNATNGRWKKVIIDYPDYIGVLYADGKREFLASEIDTNKQVLTLEDQDFTYVTTKDQLLLDGLFGTDTLQVKLKPYDLDKFSLLSRGFNWVNEVPYNRYDKEE
ncbi:MAG: hypothetical protein AAF597_08375 [Bacteroidota bacterium]